MIHEAISLDGRNYLCGCCEGNEAKVAASINNTGWYGHCVLCDHTVFLGTHGKHWQHGSPWGVINAAGSSA